jgi:transcriptional regulator with XRE-family HTH domain
MAAFAENMGIEYSTLRRWELGEAPISNLMLKELAERYGDEVVRFILTGKISQSENHLSEISFLDLDETLELVNKLSERALALRKEQA